MIKTLCSDGTKISEATIKSRLSKAYRDKYEGNPHPYCAGCGGKAQGSAHIIPKSQLKLLGLSDKIYHPDFFFAACYKCNQVCENISSGDIKKLMNYQTILELIRTYDVERYKKML